MRRAKHFISILMAVSLLSTLVPAAALAREKISQVTLSFSMDTDTWSELDVDGGDGYTVRSVSLFPDGGNGSTSPYAVVILDAEEDYYFSSIKSNYFSLDGDGATFLEAARSNSNATMTVSVRFKELGEGELNAPAGLAWTDAGVATWEKVPGAGDYSIRIQRNGTLVGVASAPTTKVNVYNLSTKITKTGDYVFQVRANGLFKKTKSSEWVSSPVLSVDEAKLAAIQAQASTDAGVIGEWHQDDAGYWYQYTTGLVPKGEWREIEGFWYYFNDSGYRVVDQWVDRYYVGSDGKMLVDTTTPDGHYVDENGAWAPK